MENTFDFLLSIKNLKDIPFEKYEQDFIFHMKGKTYKTNRFIADLLSPYVCQLHYSDKTSQEFYIEQEHQKGREQIREDDDDENDEDEKYFLEFLRFYTIENEIDSKRREYYIKYFCLLGNIEEMIRIECSNDQDMNINEAVERLLRLQRNIKEISSNQMIESLISIVSKEFEKVDKEKMKHLEYEIIERIINNDELKLKDEDSLFEFITELYSNDHKYSPLFEYVLFNNISKQNIEKFIEIFEIEYLNQGIWKSICQRLISKSDKSTSTSKITSTTSTKQTIFDRLKISCNI